MKQRVIHRTVPHEKDTQVPDQRGFTLLEVIFAISILTFGILAVGSMQISSIRGNNLASNLTEGTCIACDRMELLMTRSYTHADLASGITHSDPNPPAGYAVSWQIDSNFPIANTKTVTVTVTWADRGVQRSTVLRQIIPRYI